MAIAQARLTAQGQIWVPAAVRRKLGVGPGSTLEWHEQGEKIVVGRVGRFTSADLHERVSFPDWKLMKMDVNTQDLYWSEVSTTSDGKELIYSSVETVNKIGVIENLFK